MPEIRKRRAKESYKTYINRVCKQVHPSMRISKRGMADLNSFCTDTFQQIAEEAGRLVRWTSDTPWRATFVVGLLVGGGLLMAVAPEVIQEPATRSLPLVGGAGLLVGVGTRLANGCTSGHGVCGLSRRSMRSLVATLSFMATGFITASLFGLLQGGA